MKGAGSLAEEAKYWNDEYYRCFGEYPNPLIAEGVPMQHVAAVQSAVMRHWVEALKQQVGHKYEDRSGESMYQTAMRNLHR